MNFTKDELQFIIDILANINVAMKDPNAPILIQKGQNIINKASKMIDSFPIPLETPENK